MSSRALWKVEQREIRHGGIDADGAAAKGPAMLTKAEDSEGDVHEPSAISSGQRERNKRDKLLRIKNAAQELFVSKGYDDTTTREIAVRAGVGMGTVFTYAANKRDLLFLIANDD